MFRKCAYLAQVEQTEASPLPLHALSVNLSGTEHSIGSLFFLRLLTVQAVFN